MRLGPQHEQPRKPLFAMNYLMRIVPQAQLLVHEPATTLSVPPQSLGGARSANGAIRKSPSQRNRRALETEALTARATAH